MDYYMGMTQNNEYASIGHLFLVGIETFFESYEKNAIRELQLIKLFKKGMQTRIPNGNLLILPLDCISDKDDTLNLFYDGKRLFDGYFFLNYQESTVILTPMGAWQIALLRESTWLMPLFWHSNYGKIQLILSNDDLHDLRNSSGYVVENHEFIPVETPCSPSVEVSKDEKSYEVVYHYWSEFEGYVENHLRISSKDGLGLPYKIKDLLIEEQKRILYPYQAGIRF
ncbi:MAG: hypothetical protein K2J46_02260 [Muribaculaceae bacterium]|nr:hypothetical protein [Muribaculaceae bacterium]